MDSVVIGVKADRRKEIGQLLLSLADSPRDVQWVTWPAAGYAVSDELFARFEAAQEPAETEEPKQEKAPAPKRRGRPRKEPAVQEETSTDNTSSESEEE